MKVTVVDRETMNANWGTGLYRVITKTVEISNRCPVCGGPRGEPKAQSLTEDGEHYSADIWANPCGHVDRYSDVLAEAGNIPTCKS